VKPRAFDPVQVLVPSYAAARDAATRGDAAARAGAATTLRALERELNARRVPLLPSAYAGFSVLLDSA
jgi:hypothetical protein